MKARSRQKLSWMIALGSICSVALLAITAGKAWTVTLLDTKEPYASEPTFIALGEFVEKNLSENAVLLFDEQVKLEHNTARFRTRRTCYPLRNTSWQAMGRNVIAAGGKPYVVSARELPLKPIYSDPIDRRTIYEWTDDAPTTARSNVK